MDATAISPALAYDAAIGAEAEKLRDDMRREHGLSGYVACSAMAHSTGSPARWGATFYSSELSSHVHGYSSGLDALYALRDAIAEKLGARPSLEALAATLGCEVPK